MPPASKPKHDAFLVRIWRESQQTAYRAFVENVHTGEKRGFRDLNALVSFLHRAYGNRNAVDEEGMRDEG